ncbi:Z1 domain-containing protein [Flavobacterium okayamense]|uniref:Endonuclease n=1 Tax=Flavobacterium okayamense TaxID=2830782 RepID=A0ABN6HY67_9FLAO|nr:Z1 domain-containing protein [Flavobacterium okayamense]BCY29338.1 endonuclease [Flavobacterium okayamense]
MNEIIDQIKSLIVSNYNQFFEANGYVDRDFFEGDDLKNKCKSSLIIIFPILFSGKTYNLSDNDFDEKYSIALRDVRYNYKTIMNPSLSIQNEYKDTWLNDERIKEIGWYNDETKAKTYRGRYLLYLEKKLGRSKSMINETERSSLEIIKKIGDPKNTNNFFVKGLVVGSVQSGKTSNFNAVVNSSIDVGYKLIIVLSGIMEDLRRQTQIRTEKEVEGKMIAQDKFIGVGEIASFGQLGQFADVNQVILPTSTQNDFNRTMQQAHFSLNNTNILICKKNTSVLQNLLLWLNEYLLENNDKHNIPFLIIDDEADNASINNLGHKGSEYANKINGHIRALLALFNRKTYIGYTATPFANILQDWNKKPETKWKVKDSRNNFELEFDQEGNLFPDDFIELLIPPSNYIGPKNFFETRIEDIKKIEPLLAEPLNDYIEYFPERVEILSDDSLLGVKKYNNQREFDCDLNARTRFGTFKDYKEATRATTKYDNFPIEIPKSLDEAIKCFIVSIAIRLSRRPELIQSKLFHPHNTMLIHISRFSDWQCKTKKLIIEKIDYLKTRLNNDTLSASDSIFIEFERIWIKYYAEAINNIREYLPENYEDEYLTRKTFLEVRDLLVSAINGIEVKAVNTVEKDILDYESGEKKYIVIGGNKLSRGFTLEGLTINYFIRNTNYADTLLQMGRWFGYRPGYLDCCKLFTTADSFEKFDQCTWTIEELEEEFRMLSKAKKKPRDYATKVLTHPGALQITRPAILKNTITEKWSFEDKLLQTTDLLINKSTIESSWNNFKSIYSKHKENFFYDDFRKAILLKTDVNGLEDFLISQTTFVDFPTEAIVRFVRKCNEFEKLTNWTIAIKTTGSTDKYLQKNETNFANNIELIKRSSSKKGTKYYTKLLDKNIFKVSGGSSNILSGGRDMSMTLEEEKIALIEQEFKAKYNKNTPEKAFREKMKPTDGLLVVFLMDLTEVFRDDALVEKADNENIDLTIPLIGYAIGIPPIDAGLGEDYLINVHIRENENNSLEEEDESDEIESLENE